MSPANPIDGIASNGYACPELTVLMNSISNRHHPGSRPAVYGPIASENSPSWWGKDAANLNEFYQLKEGDCV